MAETALRSFVGTRSENGAKVRYDLARDHIVGNVTGHRVDRNSIKEGYVLSGTVEKRGWRYTTTVDWDDTLLPVNRSTLLLLSFPFGTPPLNA